tara:strand:+ start:867 stop:1664 length:798 start_codon:yes stop_codon:yes gene_type:complete
VTGADNDYVSGLTKNNICDVNNPGSGFNCEGRYVRVSDNGLSVGADTSSGDYYQCQWKNGACHLAAGTPAGNKCTPFSSLATLSSGRSNYPPTIKMWRRPGRGDNSQCGSGTNEKCSIGDGDCDDESIIGTSDTCEYGMHCIEDTCTHPTSLVNNNPAQGAGGGVHTAAHPNPGPANTNLTSSDECCWWICPTPTINEGWKGNAGEKLPHGVTWGYDKTPWGCLCAVNFRHGLEVNEDGDQWRCWGSAGQVQAGHAPGIDYHEGR